MTTKTTNQLINESSPYLKQHAENPVNWYPWNEEALARAKKENKPILLSIGYAACHWCHVMAHESFSDKETAALMNQYFVNIKVDREERPDLDKIYQTAHYYLTQQAGGWPLTLFLTPDLVPFFSGTYFPKEQRYQLPAFKQVLQTIAQIYAQQKEQIEQQNTKLSQLLQQNSSAPEPIAQFTDAPLYKAQKTLQKQFDHQHGGFNGAPKFPQSTKLLFLLQTPHASMVYDTLTKMAAGGIYDQLGGGFFRYTVDAAWQIPHFEKMLYDNASLIYLYCEAFRLTQNNTFADVIYATIAWCGFLKHPAGGFYSSLNADAEGEEGKYYLWDQQTFNAALSPEEQAVAGQYFGMNLPPNVDGKWHLFVAKPIAEIAQQHQQSVQEINKIITSSIQNLLASRKKRTPPSTDTKILTAWNSLLIKSLYYAAWQLDNDALVHLAEANLKFILHKLYNLDPSVKPKDDTNHRLLAVFADDTAKQPAFLDDYVFFLVDALLMALQVRWHSDFLHAAQALAYQLLEEFWDPIGGGFYFTSDQQEKLLYRPKTFMDEATPSGNGIAAQIFLLLGHLLANEHYLAIAEKLLATAWTMLEQYPSEHCSLLLGLQQLLEPKPIVILRGESDLMKSWQSAIKKTNAFIFAIPSHARSLPDTLLSYSVNGPVCAYVCQGRQCSAVIKDLSDLEKMLHKNA